MKTAGAVLLMALALTATTQAAVRHEYLSQITEVPASSGAPLTGSLSAVSSLTVASGHVWVAEHIEATSDDRTDEFEAASGAFVRQFSTPPGEVGRFGVAVGQKLAGEPTVYLGGQEEVSGEPKSVVFAFSEAGSLLATWTGSDTPSGSFGQVRDVAVDNSKGLLDDGAEGDVYVADSTAKAIDVFRPKSDGGEEYVTQLTEADGTPFTRPQHVAVDQANGDVLVVDETSGGFVVDVFEPEVLAGSYRFVDKITGPPPTGAFGSEGSDNIAAEGEDVYVTKEAEGGAASVVYEFKLDGAFLGQITGEATPAGTFGNAGVASVAVDPETGGVYVGDKGAGGVVDAFGPNVTIPSVETGVATEARATGGGAIEAKLNGEVNPEGAGAATCKFVYGTTTAFGESVPCSASVANGSSAMAVSATVTGLEPDTTYFYRLQAGDANGTNPGEEWQDGQLTTPGPGLSGGAWSSEVSSTAATLAAKVDPHGVPTSVYFQYGTSTAYGSVVPAPPGTVIGSGEAAVEVAEHIQGLQPGTEYHYRVVVASELTAGQSESFHGADLTFTTGSATVSTALPDGRQWQLVSPLEKHGAALRGVGFSGGLVKASADGQAITYLASGPIEQGAEGEPSGQFVQLLSQRGAGGEWVTRDIATRHEALTGGNASAAGKSEYPYFSEDLSLAVAEPVGSTLLSPLASERTPYLRSQARCEAQASAPECFLPLASAKQGDADVTSGNAFGGSPVENPFHGSVRVAGTAPNPQHLVLSSAVPLLKGETGEGLYEWSAGAPAAEALQPVDVLPDGEKASCAGGLGQGVTIGEETTGNVQGAVSADGSRVVWTENKAKEGCEEHLYLRDMAKRETVQLDVVQPHASGAGKEDSPVFQIASSAGNRIFFTDEQALTEDSGATQGDPDLYACEIVEAAGRDKCKLTDLTPGSATERADVLGRVIGISEEGTYVYFVADGALAPGATQDTEPCNDEEGHRDNLCNLYVDHYDGREWEAPRLVAALSGADSSAWEKSTVGTARVSPNGQWLTFMSDRPLTGYDNHDAVSGEPDEEVYLYHAEDEKLVCASCDPTGARPDGLQVGGVFAGEVQARLVDGDELWSQRWVAGMLPEQGEFNAQVARYQPRYLSDEGRLFFNSPADLVPQAANGTWDVYEYEPPGLGSCSESSVTYSARSDGCVGLISSGESSEESAFQDASENGEDVFFLTAASLVPQDTNGEYDLYDAQVCTAAAPCQATTAATVPPPCESATGCKEAIVGSESALGTPGSATFSGAGNLLKPVSKPTPKKTKKKALTRAQKRKRALKACRKRSSKAGRARCEKSVRKRYAAKTKNQAGRGGSR